MSPVPAALSAPRLGVRVVGRKAQLGVSVGACAALLVGLAAWWSFGLRAEPTANAPAPSTTAPGVRGDAALAAPPEVGPPEAPRAAAERVALDAAPVEATPPDRRIAAGRVVDDSGAPVAGAEVRAVIGSHAPARSRTELDAHSDALGAFAFDGERDSADFVQLSAHAGSDFVDAQTDVPPGTTDVLLVLARGGWIEGRILGDDLARAPELRVLIDGKRRFERFFDRGRLGWHGRFNRGWRGDHEARVGADATFRAGPIRPGDWRVRVVRSDEPWILADVADVLVVAGQTARDPRLDPLDLRGRLRAIELRVVDRARRPIGRGSILFWQTGGDPDDGETALIRNGIGRIVAPPGALDVLAGATGHRTARVERLKEDTQVVLGAGLPVRLVLRSVAPPLPPDRLCVRLEPAEGQFDPDQAAAEIEYEAFREQLRAAAADGGSELSPSPWGDGSADVPENSPESVGAKAVEASGEARFELVEPGRYRVSWNYLASEPDGSTTWGEWLSFEEVVVVDIGDEQVLSVRLDADQLENLRHRMDLSR